LDPIVPFIWCVYIPTEYPTFSGIQPLGLQYPKTPKVTPLYDARGMPFIIGVERVDRSSSRKAIK
jgi:hypothetical protein